MADEYSDEDYPEETRDLLEFVRNSGIAKYPCSPPALLVLYRRMKEDPRIKRLIHRFNSPASLEKAEKEALDFVKQSLAYRVLDKSSINVGICGHRSLGKSELMMVLQKMIIDTFRQLSSIDMKYRFSRDYTSTNTELKNAVDEGYKVVIGFDEPEKGAGRGIQKEQDAFWNNVNTIRILLLNIIKVGVLFDWAFALHCDFFLEVIFKDKDKRKNYAIVWVIDPMNQERYPEFILGLPLHEDEEMRTEYEKVKMEEQLRLTSSRGRSNRSLEALRPVCDALVQHAIDLTDKGLFNADELANNQRKWKDLRTLLTMDIAEEMPLAGSLSGDETEDVCRKAIMELYQWYQRPQAKPSVTNEYHWTTKEFTWRAEVANLMREHPRFSKFYPFWYASEVMNLNPSKNSKEFTEITGRSQSQNYKWLDKIDKNKSLDGWIKQARSELHESFIAEKLREAGWHVEEKSLVTIDGQEYEEDMFIAKDGQEFYINAKCGNGMRTYVNSQYKVTYLIHTVLKRPAFILYTDLETGIHYSYQPLDRFSVGTGAGAVSSTENFAKSRNPSTPFLSGLAGEAGGEGTAGGRDGQESVVADPEAEGT